MIAPSEEVEARRSILNRLKEQISEARSVQPGSNFHNSNTLGATGPNTPGHCPIRINTPGRRTKKSCLTVIYSQNWQITI